MITVRCKDCNKEVTNESGSCGCPNMVRVSNDVVTAIEEFINLIDIENKKEVIDYTTSLYKRCI